MGTVAVLAPALASQIAAGEVVERPASVIKELVENSLDAESGRVDVEIEGGGITRMAVHDDGLGMSPEDARLCLERHATSKLRAFTDLDDLGSYGFRGEALPSIASVSRLTLRTRSRDDEAATELFVDGGAPPEERPAGRSPGTTIEVRDLFVNVPARRKFLRSSGTESGHVSDIVEQLALGRPDVTFTLRRDGRKVRELLRAPGREERVRQLLTDDELIACRGVRGPLALEAFVGRPERARVGAGGLRLIVNGRGVKDRALTTCIAQAYGSILERGRYPRGVVYIDLPPQLVDVNVHPQKLEVRFADGRAVGDALYGMLSRELARALSRPVPSRGDWTRGKTGPAAPAASGEPTPFPATQPSAESPAPGKPRPSDLHAPRGQAPVAPLPAGPAVPAGPPTAAPKSSPAAPELPLSGPPPQPLRVEDAARPRTDGEPRWASLTFVAQVRRTYLVCEGDDGMFLIDQHAAAERVNFFRMKRAFENRSVASQSLLFPMTLEVSASEGEFVDEHGDELAALGFELRRRGPESLSVHAVPRLLQRASPERLVRDLLSELLREGGRAFSDAVDRALATMACHGSIRAGDRLSPEEGRALLTALDDTEFAGHCPHGRPIVSYSSWLELERKVGRR